jgi:hypothetical protein
MEEEEERAQQAREMVPGLFADVTSPIACFTGQREYTLLTRGCQFAIPQLYIQV